jgi:phage terminase large subunit GpA-like protein
VLKSARIGYTALVTASIAHFVVREPSPILVLMPTEADCRDYMVSDLEQTQRRHGRHLPDWISP